MGQTVDFIHNPPHYAGDGKIDCMRAMESMLAGDADDVSYIETYWQASALKYIWRYSRKNGIQDIDKAIQCLEYLKREREKRCVRAPLSKIPSESAYEIV